MVVASVDVGEGTVITFDMISQRSVPEQFVTSSVVKPDSASYVVNQKVLVPVIFPVASTMTFCSSVTATDSLVCGSLKVPMRSM